MAQPIRNKEITKKSNKQKKSKERKHKEYGTSKLEERFAKEFLDKLGIKYTYQFKAEDIGRYYDFLIESPAGSKIIVEIDGDFYHGYGKVWEEKNPMQKHNEFVDRIKDEWALAHGIPIIRIWEHDINNNPSKVMKLLIELVGKYNEKYIRKQNKNKRH